MKDDTISRQAAIDAIDKERKEDHLFNTAEDGLLYARGIVNTLPSAQPERKKGKWVGYDGDWLKTMCKCSECGAMIDINEKYRNFFCYHCGALMEGVQNV